MAPGESPSGRRSLCFRDFGARRSRSVRSICGSARPVEPSGWGDHRARIAPSAATILLNQLGKDLREIQELLRPKNVRTTVGYFYVGY